MNLGLWGIQGTGDGLWKWLEDLEEGGSGRRLGDLGREMEELGNGVKERSPQVLKTCN